MKFEVVHKAEIIVIHLETGNRLGQNVQPKQVNPTTRQTKTILVILSQIKKYKINHQHLKPKKISFKKPILNN